MTEQAQLLTSIREAITVLEKRYKRQPSPVEVQAYLYAEYQTIESLESVKRNGNIVLELRRKELPRFHEHEQDHLIPPGYGIDESHDGGFYPYRIVDDMPAYLKDVNGLDIRKTSYEQALEHVVEIAD